jgi:hypothetical protein
MRPTRDITQVCHTCESPGSGNVEGGVVQFELLLWDLCLRDGVLGVTM